MGSSRRYRTISVTIVSIFSLASTAKAETGGTKELDAAYARKAEKQYSEAVLAFERARAAGASGQLVALELGYLAASQGEASVARAHYSQAANGADADLARRARAELDAMAASPASPASPAPGAAPVMPAFERAPASPSAALDEAYRAKASGDLVRAAAAFQRARTQGASPQLVSFELGYVAAASGDRDEARVRFVEAERGPDVAVSDRARQERDALGKHLYADLYADALGWNRALGTSDGNNVVPTLRVRGFYRPWLSVPVDLYVSGQATRDAASRGSVGTALPRIYSDNYAIFGGGLRLRLWENRIELFGQAGPALNLIEDGRDRVAVDVRGGALTYVETRGCAPAPVRSARADFKPCLEVYAEAIYASRFDSDVVAFARPRAGAGYLVTGPVSWQAILEARAAKDINNDYWNNFADAGVGHRWRLLAPVRVDLLLSVNAGGYFGLSGRDPAPTRLGYADARGVASTYLEF